VEQCVQGAKHANAQNEYSTGERLSLREKNLRRVWLLKGNNRRDQQKDH